MSLNLTKLYHVNKNHYLFHCGFIDFDNMTATWFNRNEWSDSCSEKRYVIEVNNIWSYSTELSKINVRYIRFDLNHYAKQEEISKAYGEWLKNK